MLIELKYKKQHAFSLLEVLIALIIVSAASAIILGQLRGIMDLNVRLRQHQQDANKLLNRVAEFHYAPHIKKIQKANEISIIVKDYKTTAFAVSIKNFPKTDSPSIAQAYTPYQSYIFKSQYYAIELVMPGLKYP